MPEYDRWNDRHCDRWRCWDRHDRPFGPYFGPYGPYGGPYGPYGPYGDRWGPYGGPFWR